MADRAREVPQDLARIAEEKGIPPELVQRVLALGFPTDAIKRQFEMPGLNAQAVEFFVSEQERIRAGGEITLPDHMKKLAAQHGWPEELIKRAMRLGAQPPMIIMQMESGLRPDHAERFIVQQELFQKAASGKPEEALDLRWMHVPTEWGIRARPGKKGLTVGALNIGSYGDIPDEWPHQTEMPRGAHPLPGVPGMGYSIYEKSELWADNAADLYEEAIQRRWRPATDIPWGAIEELPGEVERAMSQLCTHLCERALVAGDVVGRWLPEMSYGYHEIKLYLATAQFDAARQFEVFRKRALSNGAGMGMQGPGYFHRAILDARRWTEASALLHVMSDSFVLGLYQVGEYVARSEGEALIFRLAMQDVGRHIAYGVQHLKYFLLRKQHKRAEIHSYLSKAEALLTFDEEHDVPLREALMVLLGGGVSRDQLLDGARKLEYFKQRWVRDYLSRLAAAGLPERRDKLHPLLKKYVQATPATAPAAA